MAQSQQNFVEYVQLYGWYKLVSCNPLYTGKPLTSEANMWKQY